MKDTIDKRVFAIWSPKAGVGKTLIAAHLARYAASKKLLTGIIDLNRQCPSAAAALDIRLPREKSLKEALYTERDSEVITNFHNNQKINENLFCLALNLNNKVDDLFEVTDAQISRLLQISKNKFNLLLLDLPTSYFELTSYEGLKFADKIIAIIDNDYNSLVALKGYLNFFTEINIPHKDIILVVNKDMGLLSEEEIYKVCNIPIAAVIPFNKHLVRDMNEGKGAFENGGGLKDRRLTKGIAEIFRLLTEEENVASKGLVRSPSGLRLWHYLKKFNRKGVSENE